MFTITQPTIRTMATSFAASALLTTLAIAGAASPAHAESNGGFVRQVERSLNTNRITNVSHTGVATIAVRIGADGKVVSADLVRSSGHKDIDFDAVATAKSVRYPEGKPRLVGVVLNYGNARLPAKAETAALVSRYVNARGEALASDVPAPNAG